MSWNLSVNVAGVASFQPFTSLPTGAYKVDITDSKMEKAKKEGSADNVVFETVITEGPHRGSSVRLWCNTDFSENIVQQNWKALLTAIAKKPEALEAGVININDTLFVGKSAYVFIQAAPEGEKRTDGKKQYDHRNFVDPTWAKRYIEAQGNGASVPTNGGQQAFQASSAQPAAGAMAQVNSLL
mgnify:CR=1 FL=1